GDKIINNLYEYEGRTPKIPSVAKTYGRMYNDWPSPSGTQSRSISTNCFNPSNSTSSSIFGISKRANELLIRVKFSDGRNRSTSPSCLYAFKPSDTAWP